MAQVAAVEGVADDARAGLYDSLEASLLRELQARLDSGNATASELATAAALLGKAGTPARSAGKGLKGGDLAAWEAWLAALPADAQARMLADAKKRGKVAVPRERQPLQVHAGELGDAA